MRARIVIIGTGTTGLCLALELARRTNPLTEPVLLISAGGLNPQELELCRHDLEGEGLALEARHGLRFWSGLWAATGRDPGWNSCGLAYEEVREEDAPAWKKLLDLGASVRREKDCVFDEDAGTLSTAKALTCLEALAREAGAVVRTGDVAQELIVEAGKVTGVKTSSGLIKTAEVVLAGARAATIAPGGPPVLDERSWTELGYETSGGEALVEETTSGEREIGDLFATNALGRQAAAAAFEDHFEQEEPSSSEVRAQVSGSSVAAPEQDGRLWVGGPKQAEVDALAQRVLGSALLKEQRTRSTWLAADERPVIGPLPATEGAWIACAFGENTSLYAPACAEALAGRVLKGETGWFRGGDYDPRRASLSWSNRAR